MCCKHIINNNKLYYEFSSVRSNSKIPNFEHAIIAQFGKTKLQTFRTLIYWQIKIQIQTLTNPSKIQKSENSSAGNGSNFGPNPEKPNFWTSYFLTKPEHRTHSISQKIPNFELSFKVQHNTSNLPKNHEGTM